jgi:hypothetical protein
MSEYVYVIEVKKPKKEGGSTLLRIQNGPKREDRQRQTEFANILLIRCPKHLKLDEITAGAYANIVYRAQGIITRKGEGKEYLTPELVANSVKPASGWQQGDESELYDIIAE